MSDTSLSWLPIILTLFFVVFFGRIFLRYRNSRRLLRQGSLGVGDVVSCSQTGVTVNSQPEMRVVVNLENVGGTPRQVEIKQIFDLGSIPRAGDRVYTLTDPTNPANVIIAPPSTAGQLNTLLSTSPATTQGTALQTPTLTTDQVQDMMALTPELQKTGKLGVVKLVSVTPVAGGATQFVADVEAIGQPPRRVTFTQVVHGPVPAAGTRTYVFVDQNNPATLALVPPSLLAGHTLPAGANRLDPLVLGPQILRDGAKASGLVTSSQEVPLGDAALAAKGITKWELGITITPANGTPAYPATLTISLLNQERVARITPVGTQLPLRYDSVDPQTFSVDGMAMGYPDPYADLLKIVQGNR